MISRSALRTITIAWMLVVALTFVLHEFVPHEHNAAIYGDGVTATLHVAAHRDDHPAHLVNFLLVHVLVGAFLILMQRTYMRFFMSQRAPPLIFWLTQCFKRGILHSRKYS